MKNNKATSTNSINRKFLAECNLTYALELTGGRWKLPILIRLHLGKKRFNELKKDLPITERMLTLRLRELERDGLVSRTVFPEVPPHVEYNLTSLGNELIPVCMTLHEWGGRHKQVHIE